MSANARFPILDFIGHAKIQDKIKSQFTNSFKSDLQF